VAGAAVFEKRALVRCADGCSCRREGGVFFTLTQN
jgi:hypothetical protein